MKHAPSFRRNPILGRIIPLASPISQRRLREGRRRLHMRWRVVYRGRTRPARCGIGRRPAIAAALGPKSLPWQSLTHHTVYLGLHWLSAWQSADLYEPIFYRHQVSSLRHHQQLGCGGRAEHLRLSHPGLQRPGQAGQCHGPDSNRGNELPGKAVLHRKLRGLAGSFDSPPSFQRQRESRALIMCQDGYAN